MMKRRWLFLVLFGLFALLVVFVFTFSTTRSIVVGWHRGEAFYQGRPTSWWAAEIERWEPQFSAWGIGGGGSSYFGLDLKDEWVCNPPDWQTSVFNAVGLKAPVAKVARSPLGEVDPSAVPMLIELLQSGQMKAQWAAIQALGRLGPDAHQAFPALLAYFQSLEQPKVYVRKGVVGVMAVSFLQNYSPNYEEESRAFICYDAIHALHRIDPEAAKAAGVPEPLQD